MKIRYCRVPYKSKSQIHCYINVNALTSPCTYVYNVSVQTIVGISEKPYQLYFIILPIGESDLVPDSTLTQAITIVSPYSISPTLTNVPFFIQITGLNFDNTSTVSFTQITNQTQSIISTMDLSLQSGNSLEVLIYMGNFLTIGNYQYNVIVTNSTTGFLSNNVYLYVNVQLLPPT